MLPKPIRCCPRPTPTHTHNVVFDTQPFAFLKLIYFGYSNLPLLELIDA